MDRMASLVSISIPLKRLYEPAIDKTLRFESLLVALVLLAVSLTLMTS